MSRFGSLAYLVGIVITIILTILFSQAKFLPIIIAIFGLIVGFINLDKDFGFVLISLFFILISPQLNLVIHSLNNIYPSLNLFIYLTCATLPAAIKLVFYED